MNGAAYDRWRLMRRYARVNWQDVTSTRDGVRMLELSDTHIRVRVKRSSPHAVVFLCDPPNLVEHFDDVFSQFDDSVSIVCIEQPSFGFSFPKAGYGFGVKDHAKAIIETLEALEFKSYTLTAPCVATYGAMRAARERPDLITKLVLMQATDIKTERKWVGRTAEKFVRLVTGIPKLGGIIVRIPYVAQLIASRTEPVFGEKTYPHVIYKPERHADLIEELIKISQHMFAKGACNCMSSLRQVYFMSHEGEFSGAPQPTLILWGDADPSHWDSPRDGLRQYVPQAKVKLITDTGHHLEIESPKMVCDHIKKFMNAGQA